MATSLVVGFLGFVCCLLSSAFWHSPRDALRMSQSQLFQSTRAGKLRPRSLPALLLGLLGTGLIVYSSVLFFSGR